MDFKVNVRVMIMGDETFIEACQLKESWEIYNIVREHETGTAKLFADTLVSVNNANDETVVELAKSNAPELGLTEGKDPISIMKWVNPEREIYKLH